MQKILKLCPSFLATKMITMNKLKNINQKYDFFVGIDSDGTVFDSMNIKHSTCFVDPLIKIYNLLIIENEVKKIWKQINLFSKNRGINRFEALYIFFRELKNNEILNKKGYLFPSLSIINYFKEMNIPMTSENFLKFKNKIDSNQFKHVKKAIKWSDEVNKKVESVLNNLSPLSKASSAIKYLSSRADLAVISNTPFNTLYRDWKNSKISSDISLICGQECGGKTDILNSLIKDKYDKNKVLMIGDSPSDYYAAKNNKVLFFPILPGKENESWKFLLSKGFFDFFSLKYDGRIQDKKIIEFESIINAKL